MELYFVPCVFFCLAGVLFCFVWFNNLSKEYFLGFLNVISHQHKYRNLNKCEKNSPWVREITWKLRILVVHEKYPGSISSTYMVEHNYP